MAEFSSYGSTNLELDVPAAQLPMLLTRLSVHDPCDAAIANYFELHIIVEA